MSMVIHNRTQQVLTLLVVLERIVYTVLQEIIFGKGGTQQKLVSTRLQKLNALASGTYTMKSQNMHMATALR